MEKIEPTLLEAHRRQIAALTDKGLHDETRVLKFAAAADFRKGDVVIALKDLRGRSPAKAVWFRGAYPLSLFGNLPGCCCPVMEVRQGHQAWPGIPAFLPNIWRPTIQELEHFAKVQQTERAQHKQESTND